MKPYVGTVEGGVVVLPPEAGFQEGQRVQVVPAEGSPETQLRVGRWIRTGNAVKELTEQERADYTDALLHLAAKTRNLPADLSTNHDHYLHGLPKR